jgi:hypothetical protein
MRDAFGREVGCGTLGELLKARFESDEGMGITQDERDVSILPDGNDAAICTNCAQMVTREFGGVVVGTEVPIKAAGAEAMWTSGHDWAIVAERYLVDPWAKLTAMTTGQAVFDLANPADAALVAEIYGHPTQWKANGFDAQGDATYRPSPASPVGRMVRQQLGLSAVSGPIRVGPIPQAGLTVAANSAADDPGRTVESIPPLTWSPEAVQATVKSPNHHD